MLLPREEQPSIGNNRPVIMKARGRRILAREWVIGLLLMARISIFGFLVPPLIIRNHCRATNSTVRA